MQHQNLPLRSCSCSRLLAAGAAPAAAADKEHRQMMADIRMLQEQSQQLQNAPRRRSPTRSRPSTRGSTARPTRPARRSPIRSWSSTRWRTTCAWCARRSTTTTCASDRSTQEVDALRQSVMEINIAPPPAVVADATAPGAPPTGRRRDNASGRRTAGAAGADRHAGHGHVADQSSGTWRSPTTPPGSTTSRCIGFESYIKSFRGPNRPTTRRFTSATSYLHDGKNDKAVEACDMAIRTYPEGRHTRRRRTTARAQALENLRAHGRGAGRVRVRRQDVPGHRRGDAGAPESRKIDSAAAVSR